MQSSRCFKRHHEILPLILQNLNASNRLKPGASYTISKATGIHFSSVIKYVLDLRSEGYIPPVVKPHITTQKIAEPKPDTNSPTTDEILARCREIRIQKGEWPTEDLR